MTKAGEVKTSSRLKALSATSVFFIRDNQARSYRLCDGRTPRAPAGRAQVFGLIPGYGRYISQQSACVRNHRRGIEPASSGSRPALHKSFDLALKFPAGARGTPRPLLTQHKRLKMEMALLADIFEDRHGYLSLDEAVRAAGCSPAMAA
jgi:hypothetical protein